MDLKHRHPEKLDKIPDQCLHSTILYDALTPISNEEARSFHVRELLRLTLLHPLFSSRTMTQLGSKHSSPILNTTTPNYSQNSRSMLGFRDSIKTPITPIRNKEAMFISQTLLGAVKVNPTSTHPSTLPGL